MTDEFVIQEHPIEEYDGRGKYATVWRRLLESSKNGKFLQIDCKTIREARMLRDGIRKKAKSRGFDLKYTQDKKTVMLAILPLP